MEKNKINIVLIIVSFIVGMLVMLGISFITKEKCAVCERCPNTNEPTKNEGESHILEGEEKKKFDELYSIAVELYNNEKYLNYPTDQKDVYAVTYKDLSELGYNMDKYKNCNQEMDIIYFDPNNVLAPEYMGEPIQINIICNYPQ